MSITTIIGPMFSGKTSELIRLVDRKRIAGKKCLIIKHSSDNRFDNTNNVLDKNHITTHSQLTYKKCDIEYLTELTEDVCKKYIENNYHVIGIDEGFFFINISKYCNYLANNNIDIIVASIESSYKQELFVEIGNLIAVSENVIKTFSVCMQCSADNASFTIRTNDSKENILVGGTDMYQSICRKCLVSRA